MMRYKSYLLLLAVFLCLGWLIVEPRALSAEMEVTDSFDVVAKRVQSFADRYGPEEVLLVCDIDNTVLTMNQGLGSVAWFDTQYRLLREDPKSKELVGHDLPSLLKVQALLFTLSRMHPPEKTIPDKIAALQKQGIYTMCLTSRGPSTRNATEAALRRNRYDFARRAPKTFGGFCGETKPYRLGNLSASGLSREEAERFHLGEPRSVSYDKGIFMVAGQNKGAMLLLLLARCPRRFSAIVFIDDKEEHVKEVFTAVVARNIEIVAYRYSREDGATEAFNKTGRQKAQQQWETLRQTLDDIFD